MPCIRSIWDACQKKQKNKKKKKERERGIPRAPTKTHYDEIPISVYLAKVLSTSEH